MRDYKFRGKTKNGEWVYGSLVITTQWFKHMPHTHTKTWIIQSAFGNGGWFNIMQRQYVLPETVGQFTGLLDKNGVEVYEGDIYSTGDMKILKVVEWHDTGLKGKQIGTFGSYEGLTYHQKWIEVIGNTHDNSDLLK